MTKTEVKDFFTKKTGYILLIIITSVWCILAGFNIFSKLDYRMYDMLLHLKKAPPSNNKLMFVEIDNESIADIGAWPWTRDIIADGLIRMKELGAADVLFDIEYLSPSQKGINPTAEETLSTSFSDSKTYISDTISELTNAIASNMVTSKDVPSLADEMMASYINPEFDSLYKNITADLFRDNDKYFSETLGFFGNSYLTVNMKDIAIKVSDTDVNYVKNRFLLTDVEDKENLIKRDTDYFYNTDDTNENKSRGFTPPLHEFVKNAKGIGFTNVIVDSDGTRRRVDLIYNEDDKYVPQLSFAPLLDILQSKDLVRTKKHLIIKNALIPGKKARQDIHIPLDNHGRMLINWSHKPFNTSFRSESFLFLHEMDQMESNIYDALSSINNMQVLDDNGYPLQYINDTTALVADYKNIKETKASLLARCIGYDKNNKPAGKSISEDEYTSYFAMRKSYFDAIGTFIKSDGEKNVLARLMALKTSENKKAVEDYTAQLSNFFDSLSHEYKLYTTYSSEMSKAYKDSFCIIGSTTSSSTDLGVTPFQNSYPNIGTHANVMNTILQEDFITPLPAIYGIIIAIIGEFAFLFTNRRKENSVTVKTFSGILLILIVLGIPIILMITKGWYIPVLIPFLIMLTFYIAETILNFLISDKDKKFLRHAFSTYLSGDVVDQIVKDPQKLTLGGQEKHITALFTDIKSFSSFSEMVTPTQLVSILNEYLGMLSDIILANHGTIDKYIGDEIVSFFGAPIDDPQNSWHACCAGIRMKQAEAEFNKKHLELGDIPRELETRVGINTGEMVVGNMGTDLKMNYTIMGNDVNLASRLEGVNKVYASWIMCSEKTWNEADSGENKGKIVSRRFDRVRVVGIDTPVQLYNIVGFRDELSEAQLKSINIYNDAMDRYLAREFKVAAAEFKAANDLFPEDLSAHVYELRCKEYMTKAIPDDWDGVVNMTSK